MQLVNNIADILSSFNCSADISSLRVFGSGHINNTYFLKNTEPGGPAYLLQRINHYIFKDVEQLTDNMCRVIGHLKDKVRLSGGDPEKEVMTLIPCKNGKYFYKDEHGDYWRMAYFLKDTKTYDIVETEKQAYQAGEAFGKFQKMLSDVPPGILHDVIPDFHNAEKRLLALFEAVKNDPIGRVKDVMTEVEYLKQHAPAMLYFQQPEQQAALPRRVTHNDTKFNNVLLDRNDEAQCVIDLDTVMDGYVAFDFGDAIRTIINTGAEDEADPGNIQLNIPLFKAYTAGYLKEAAAFVTPAEVDSLIKGVLLLPFTQTVRFLTDYINGDTYYKIKFEGHNLQRTYAQLQLFKLLFANADKLNGIIMDEMNAYR